MSYPEGTVFGHPQQHDLLLFATVSVLLGLSAITTPPQSPSRKDRVYSWLFYGARISILVFVLVLTWLPPRWRNQLKVVRDMVLLVFWAVYAYRDIWPLVTDERTPVDSAEGNLLWIKIGFLTLAAIVLPLLSPRHWQADDPRVLPVVSPRPAHNPHAFPEQNSSIFSFVAYGWWDTLIRGAQYLPNAARDSIQLTERDSVQDFVQDSYANVEPDAEGQDPVDVPSVASGRGSIDSMVSRTCSAYSTGSALSRNELSIRAEGSSFVPPHPRARMATAETHEGADEESPKRKRSMFAKPWERIKRSVARRRDGAPTVTPTAA